MESQQLDMLIITHHDCMDGLGSDLVLKLAHKGWNTNTLYVQYKGEDIIKEHLKTTELSYDKIICSDFVPPIDYLELLYNSCYNMEIYDHHISQKETINEFKNKHPDVHVVFDIARSGAKITFDVYKSLLKERLHIGEFENLEFVINLIEDRDLWLWKIPNSKILNTALSTLTNKKDIETLIELVISPTPSELKDMLLAAGGAVELSNSNTVNKKVDDAYFVTIDNVKFACVNSTTLVSEIGNGLCLKYNRPALVYFMVENKGKIDVVCSLRSLDTLIDIMTIAVRHGGGGHRNAAGFTMSLEQLTVVLGTVTVE